MSISYVQKLELEIHEIDSNSSQNQEVSKPKNQNNNLLITYNAL